MPRQISEVGAEISPKRLLSDAFVRYRVIFNALFRLGTSGIEVKKYMLSRADWIKARVDVSMPIDMSIG